MKKINVGIIGFGTIGAGVVRALKNRRLFLKEKNGVDINIARICDKDLKTKRPVSVPAQLLTRSIGKVIYDPNIDVVVELIGGIRPARDIILESLRQGKHVVTANKALLSDSGDRIFSLANELGLCVGFEASVGGGIPIIRALKEGFVADRIDLIYGIINGTSNFILSMMSDNGLGFKEALSMAQAKGYAERDPYLDISGGDSAHKLSVLALLGFGAVAKASDIYTEGILGIEQDDIRYASEMGYAIKLLAIAKRAGQLLELRVHPTLISKSHLLANVGGAYNAIFVRGDLVGENLFYGQGAGPSPTSSAVLSDIVAIARCACGASSKIEQYVGIRKDVKAIESIDRIVTRHYIKFLAIDKPGVLAKISGVLAKYGISI
ncbi:MAG: homoserine dehydrogenase, partial [Candidatus Omnitrophica bacterium]|nr:homoserine dehydrogenase [Candidatus Omnitrophota bacterium]